jgi:hypothetical protein
MFARQASCQSNELQALNGKKKVFFARKKVEFPCLAGHSKAAAAAKAI